MTEWKEIEIQELTTKIGSGATPRGGSNSYKLEGISLIRSQNVLDMSFSNDGLAFIDEEQANGLKNVIVEEEDILLNITGDSVARVCKVPKKILPARVNQHVAIIRADKNKLIPDFLLYNLIAQKKELLSQSEIGATRRAITKGMIEKYQIQQLGNLQLLVKKLLVIRQFVHVFLIIIIHIHLFIILLNLMLMN